MLVAGISYGVLGRGEDKDSYVLVLWHGVMYFTCTVAWMFYSEYVELHRPTMKIMWICTVQLSKKETTLSMNERLHSVTAQFDQLRSIRFRNAVSGRIPRRKLQRVVGSDSLDVSKPNDSEVREPAGLPPEPLKSSATSIGQV